MTRYLRLSEVLELHRRVIKQCGGTVSLRDLGTSGLASSEMNRESTDVVADIYPGSEKCSENANE